MIRRRRHDGGIIRSGSCRSTTLLLFNEVAVASSEQSLIVGTAARSSGGISPCIVGKASTMEKETTERIEAMESDVGVCSCCLAAFPKNWKRHQRVSVGCYLWRRGIVLSVWMVAPRVRLESSVSYLTSYFIYCAAAIPSCIVHKSCARK